MGTDLAPPASRTPARRAGRHANPDRAGQRVQDRRLGIALVSPSVLALLLITAFPLLYNMWNAVHRAVLSDPADRGFAGLDNFRQALGDDSFTPTLVRTLAFAAVSVIVQIAAGIGIAVVLNRPFRGRAFVRAAVLIPWAVPTVVSATSWKTMFDERTGFVNYLLGALHLPGAHTTWLAGEWTAWTAILVADSWKTVPLVAIILLAGLQTIPGEVYEAARIDGASAWQAFRRVTLPLLKPALLVAVVFRTLSALLVFDTVFIMTGGGPGDTTETLSYVNWQAFMVDADFGTGGAISVVLVVLSLLVAFAITRLFRTDNTA
jgi:ABC-type sugar transport system permease subunit